MTSGITVSLIQTQDRQQGRPSSKALERPCHGNTLTQNAALQALSGRLMKEFFCFQTSKEGPLVLWHVILRLLNACSHPRLKSRTFPKASNRPRSRSWFLVQSAVYNSTQHKASSSRASLLLVEVVEPLRSLASPASGFTDLPYALSKHICATS
jgi:hypothetical protein